MKYLQFGNIKCTVFEIFVCESTVTGFGVIQGHWKWHHSIDRTWLLWTTVW